MKLFKLIVLITLLPILSCKKKTIPQGITANAIENGTTNSVFVNIAIESDGGTEFTEVGVCYSVDSLPTINNDKVVHTTPIMDNYDFADTSNINKKINTFHVVVKGLTVGNCIFIRAYAKNKIGIIYSNQISYTIHLPIPILYNPTIQYDSIADNEGTFYKTVVIGNQTWMAENLKTSHFNNGDLISTTNQFPYLYDEKIVDVYGRLYTFYAIEDSRGICPAGWHVPTKIEWDSLLQYVGNNVGQLKESGDSHWANNGGSVNSSGFTAIPSGFYLSATFSKINQYSNYWSSTLVNSSKVHDLLFNDGSTWYEDIKESAFSIRCIKD